MPANLEQALVEAAEASTNGATLARGLGVPLFNPSVIPRIAPRITPRTMPRYSPNRIIRPTPRPLERSSPNPAPHPGTGPQTTPRPPLVGPNTGQDTEIEPYYDPSVDDEGEFPSPREEEVDDYRRRRKRRRRNCCKPEEFPLWAKPARAVSDGHMGLSLPWEERTAMQKGYTYQVCMFGRQEYLCSGGGENVNADSSFPMRCWIGEAKYVAKISHSAWVNGETQLNRIQRIINAAVRDEYRRYGIVSRNPDLPAEECWNIGLLTLVGGSPRAVPYFGSLYSEFDIEGMVAFSDIRDSCKGGGGDDHPPQEPPRINEKGEDWWNYDPDDPDRAPSKLIYDDFTLIA